jgi:hypothetical protein
LSGEGGVVKQIDAVTVQGLAGVSFAIDRPGLLEIRAESDPALTSLVYQMNVTGEGFTVTILAPTPSIVITPTQEVFVTPEVEPSSPLSQGYPGLGGWSGMVLILGGLGYLAFWSSKRFVSPRWAMRLALCTITGGIVGFTYLAVRMPGAEVYLQRNGWLGMMGVILLGAAVGFGAAFTWRRLSTESKKPPD